MAPAHRTVTGWALVGLAALTGNPGAAPAGGDGLPGLPVELRLARREALQAQYQSQLEQVAAGKDPLDGLLSAHRALTEAELDLFDGPAGEVAALERAVARLRDVERLAVRVRAAGGLPQAAADKIVAARQAAEARLRARRARE